MTATFRLVYGDPELALPLPIDPVVGDQLLDRLRGAEVDGLSQAELGRRLATAIAQIFCSDPIPPSERQLKYAQSICRELALVLPADCVLSQEAARDFITRHAPDYQRLRISQSKGAEPGTAESVSPKQRRA